MSGKGITRRLLAHTNPTLRTSFELDMCFAQCRDQMDGVLPVLLKSSGLELGGNHFSQSSRDRFSINFDSFVCCPAFAYHHFCSCGTAIG